MKMTNRIVFRIPQPNARRRGTLLAAGLLFAAALPASDIAAQTGGVAAAELDVLNRARPELDPLGMGGEGGFVLYPSFEIGLAGDDNIYRQPEEETSDTVRYFRPRIFGVSRWSRHEFLLDAGMDASDFANADGENVTNWYAGLGGRIDISRDAWLRANLTLRELHEERGDPESPFTALEPVSRKMSDLAVEAFRRWNRFSFGIEGRSAGLAYEDAVDAVTGRILTQRDRDRDEREVSARIGLDISPGNEIFLRATRFSRRYDRLQGEDLFARDSDGEETALGIKLDVGALIGGELFAGYRKQSYDRDERLPEVDGISYGGALTWNPTPLTTVRGAARRTVNESALRRASGYLASSVNIGLDHELRRNVLIGGDVGLFVNEYVGIEREDEIVTGTIRLVWKINRTAEADLGLRIQRRESSFPRDNYDKDYVYLNVRFKI